MLHFTFQFFIIFVLYTPFTSSLFTPSPFFCLFTPPVYIAPTPPQFTVYLSSIYPPPPPFTEGEGGGGKNVEGG